MKRERSKVLYAIMVLDKNESRDKSISQLLDEEYIPKAEGGNFIRYLDISYLGHAPLGRTYDFHNRILRCKVWKTYKGAEKVFNSIKPHKDDEFQIVEVTDIWNKDIDISIKEETEQYNLRIKDLLNKKI